MAKVLWGGAGIGLTKIKYAAPEVFTVTVSYGGVGGC